MTVKVSCSSYRKDRNATSDMSFLSPAMDNMRRVEILSHRCCSASTRRSCPAVMDRFDISMFAHAMVGVLSQNILM